MNAYETEVVKVATAFLAVLKAVEDLPPYQSLAVLGEASTRPSRRSRRGIRDALAAPGRLAGTGRLLSRRARGRPRLGGPALRLGVRRLGRRLALLRRQGRAGSSWQRAAPLEDLPGEVCHSLAWLNLSVLAINILPVWKLDGALALRSLRERGA
jgi:hypothetical protein